VINKIIQLFFFLIFANIVLSENLKDNYLDAQNKNPDEYLKCFANKKLNSNINSYHLEFAELITETNFFPGVDANYSLQMIDNGKKWNSNNIQNIFEILTNKGINTFRLRQWTCDTDAGSLDYVLKIANECKKNNIALYLVLFLSDNWSDYVKQPVPEKWKNLPFTDKINKIREYSKTVVSEFIKTGVTPVIYEIGNEIDFGICGEFENEWHNRFNYEYMKKNIWLKSAQIIAAAQTGILEVDTNAKFVLHLTQWWNIEFCLNFFNYMLQNNVRIDYLGLSYFPTSNMSEKNDLKFFESITEQLSKSLNRKIIVCEYGYPSKNNFSGQFTEWNKQIKGYELNEAGQAQWITDFLSVCGKNNNIRGAFYWSPEWYDSEMWEAFSLFDKNGNPKKAINSFKIQ